MLDIGNPITIILGPGVVENNGAPGPSQPFKGHVMNRIIRIAFTALVAIVVASGCASTRRIDPTLTNSFPIEGTSWYGFCQGRNAFVWVPSYTDGEPDELEAVIYDDYRCIKDINPSASAKPFDPDGIVDDED